MNLPDDLRIQFSPAIWAAAEDKATFTDWNMKHIDSRTAAGRIARTNGVSVSIRQFELNAEWLGYRSGQKWPF